MLETLKKDGTVKSWLIHSEAEKDANLLEDLPINNPEETWCIIFKILQKPESEIHLTALSDCLKNLIIYHGEEFIDCIEAQAVQNARFKACIKRIHTYPEKRVPRPLWERLKGVTGAPMERVAVSAGKVFEQISNLTEVMYETPIPLGPQDAASFTENDMDRIANNWLRHQETLWAWEKINQIINEEFIEYSFNVVRILYEKSTSDIHLCAIGTGPLERLIRKNGDFIIDRIEELAARDKQFRVCLSYIWPNNISAELWKRILRARAGEPQR